MKTHNAAIAGLVLVTVAVSAWGWPQLVRRRQSTYAMGVLGKIAKGAHIYYVKPRQAEEAGKRMPCQFPQGTVVSTPASSCCDPSVRLSDAAGVCDPDKTDWDRILWRALGVYIKEPQPFVYKYEASGTFANARYTITAVSDLDCDGVFATYIYEGRGDEASTEDNCLLNSRPQFRAVNVGE